MLQRTYLNVVRERSGSKRALLFLHGFTGQQDDTWDRFPALIGSELGGSDWNIYTLGYDTSFLPDIAGIWSADPDLPNIALLYRTQLTIKPLNAFDSIALVAHSMGGLVAQYAVARSPALRQRVTHLVLFGTPSDGLRKAATFSFWKRQLRNMASGSAFISEVRAAWDALGSPLPFKLLVVAGSKDQFVPPESSLLPFDEQYQCVVPGDHLSIVKPANKSSESVRLLLTCLTEGERPARTAAMPAASALRRAAEIAAQDIDAVVAPGATFGESEIVDAALALDHAGKRRESIALLERHKDLGTDIQGTLGGRFKRLWLTDSRPHDLERARELYACALTRSTAQGDSTQIYYHAINLAFLALASGEHHEATKRAKQALEHAQRAPGTIWSIATCAEAKLYLGERSEALELYRTLPGIGKQLGTQPWMLVSAGQQAVHVARLLNDRELAYELDRIFTPSGTKIFVSYAREDGPWLEWFKLQLTPYLQDANQELELWDDSRIPAGSDWRAEIERALQHCRVAVLIASEYALGSDFIRKRELPVLVERADRHELQLLWFAVSPCAYDATELTRFQAVLSPDNPLVSLERGQQAEALLHIARKVRDAALKSTAGSFDAGRQ